MQFQLEAENPMRIWENPEIGARVRTVEKNGDPWFIAADVCQALEIIDGRQAVERLDEDERGGCRIPTPGGAQEVRAVSEAGLYTLVLGSRKPEAKTFKRWITHEVLPAIRRTGGYSIGIPQTFAEALRLAADQADQIQAQAKQIEAAAPKVAFVDRFVDAKGAKGLREVAKVLGVPPGRFIDYLISKRVLYRLGGKLTPTAVHMNKERFRVTTGEDHGVAWTQTHFTPAGIAWIAGAIEDDLDALRAKVRGPVAGSGAGK